MRVKNLETGNSINTGPDFLRHQAKPFISAAGKIYPDGVWVEDPGQKLSDEASKVIKEASKPKETPVPPVETKAPVQPTKPVEPVAKTNPVQPTGEKAQEANKSSETKSTE